MKRLSVVLLSGGLDSTTVAAYAKKRGYQPMALTLRYGQKHVREIDASRKVAESLGIRQEIVDVSFFGRLAWYSALTRPRDFRVPSNRRMPDKTQDIPITYVPLRNTFFITLAAAFLESEALCLIETSGMDPSELEASVFIAANAIDYSGYPDCRPMYYRKIAGAISAGSKLGTQYGVPICVKTPIIRKTKAEIVELAIRLKAPLAYTWSCYEGGDTPCGRCDSCILRAKGFAVAGVDDPLIVRLGQETEIA